MIPRARNTDPETSHDAARKVERFASGQCALIRLHLLTARQWRSRGCGAEQIAAGTHLTSYAIRKRLPELRKAGLVDVVRDESGSEVTRKTMTGRYERLWMAK